MKKQFNIIVGTILCFLGCVLWIASLNMIAESHENSKLALAKVEQSLEDTGISEAFPSYTTPKITHFPKKAVRVDTVIVYKDRVSHNPLKLYGKAVASWDHDPRVNHSCLHSTAFVQITDITTGKVREIMFTKENGSNKIYSPTIPNHSADGQNTLVVNRRLYNFVLQLMILDFNDKARDELRTMEMTSSDLHKFTFGG